MSSSGTSLARSRSLRKPAAGTSTDLSQKPAVASTTTTTAARNVSPSRLPAPKPSSRIPSTATTSDVDPPAASSTTTSFLKRSRPVTGGGLARSGSISRPHATAQQPKTQDQAPAPPLQPPTRSRYPPNASASAGIGAPSTTVKRPTSSGGLPSQNKPRTGPPGGFGHSRAKSTTTATTASRALSNAPVLRPPSQTSTTSTATKQRPPSVHAGRPPSASERLYPKPAAATASRTASTSTAPRSQPDTKPAPSVSRDAPSLRPKPAFSTHQQHFSPLRRAGPKTLTAAYLAPPSPSKLPSNVALSAETSRLQSSLLQLHLLHRSAPSVVAAWHASAHSTLSTRHADLASRAKALAADESTLLEARNTAALRTWAPDPRALEENIHVLDALLSALWTLHAPGGRYARIARQFARYADRLADAERARRSIATDPGLLLAADEEAFLAGPLDAEWKEQVAHLTRRLEVWASQLAEMGDVPDDADGQAAAGEKSSLARILSACRVLTRDMLAELRVMEDIERRAVERESAWMREMNREDDDGVGGGLLSGRRDTPRSGAIWRTV